MKYLYSFILVSCLMFSCTTDDESEIICDLIEPITSNLLIELVNENGENLIENGTYIPDEITVVDSNGNTFTNVVFTEVPGIETYILIGIYGQNGDNTFEIRLSDTETDTLVMNLTREETGGPCSQFIFELNGTIYNNEPIEPQISEGGFLITVVK